MQHPRDRPRASHIISRSVRENVRPRRSPREVTEKYLTEGRLCEARDLDRPLDFNVAPYALPARLQNLPHNLHVH